MTLTRASTVSACVTAALLGAGGLQAQDRTATAGRAAAEKVVKDFLAGKSANAPAVPVTDEAVSKAFPGDTFFAVIFRQYPVAPARRRR